MGFEQPEKHVEYIIADTNRLIAAATRNRWARVQQQVAAQRRLIE